MSGSASELGRQISADPKTPGGPGSCSTIAEEAVDQLQENEKLVAGERCDDEETFNPGVFRVHRDLGDEAEASREHQAAEGGRLRRDGGRHQGGRGDRGVLPAKENSTFGQPQPGLLTVRVSAVLFESNYQTDEG